MNARGPVICLEGALAVGKTTTATALAETFGAFVVLEMNQLFRSAGEDPNAPNRRSFGEIVASMPPNWYLERQVERWQIAWEAAQTYPFAVLDRDPFQPLWYRWAFSYEGGGQTPVDLRAFYRSHLADGSVRFPDLYVLLVAEETELRCRKEADTIRVRRGFDIQSRFFEPQKRYFAAMADLAPDRVCILNSVYVADNVAAIIRALPPVVCEWDTADEVALFDALTDWLASNLP